MTQSSGIVLAAGEGRRMGGTKSLLVVHGTPLIAQHVARLVEVGCTSIAVVVRPEAADAAQALLHQYRQAQVAAVTTSSQADSLAAGLRVLGSADSKSDDVVIITPVDLLPPKPGTYQALLACLTGDTLAVTPECGGRGGHPVVARRALLAAYAPTRCTPPSLREVLNQAGQARRRVPVDDRLVLGDFDTPADLMASGART